MSVHILITGGAGYIGSVLTRHLLEQGHRVTVLDSLVYRQASLLHLCHWPTFEFIRGDARDVDLLKRVVPEFDVLIPLAALVGAPACDRDPMMATSVNLEAVLALNGIRSKHQRVLFPTTNSGYGVGEQDTYCTEETPLRPISLYGRTKVEAEQALLQSENVITFRLATVFGVSPRMRLDLLVNDFTHRAVKDRFIVLFEEHFRRNFIHVRDVAGAFLFGLEHFERLKNQPYNVGLSSANLSKRQLCEVIRRRVPELVVFSSPVGKDPDQRNYVVSNEKIEKAGWRPMVSLDEGIEELLKAYRMLASPIGYGNV